MKRRSDAAPFDAGPQLLGAALAVIAAAAVLVPPVVYQVRHFGLPFTDVCTYARPIWNVLEHGRMAVYTDGTSDFFADQHFEPFLFLLVPIVRLFGTMGFIAVITGALVASAAYVVRARRGGLSLALDWSAGGRRLHRESVYAGHRTQLPRGAARSPVSARLRVLRLRRPRPPRLARPGSRAHRQGRHGCVRRRHRTHGREAGTPEVIDPLHRRVGSLLRDLHHVALAVAVPHGLLHTLLLRDERRADDQGADCAQPDRTLARVCAAAPHRTREGRSS